MKDIFYYLSVNEDGWKKNGKKLGFRPDLDRELIFDKVNGILMDLHTQRFLYCSNSDDGLGLAEAVARRCKKEKRYDQYSIILFIFERRTESHSEFWKNTAKETLKQTVNEVNLSKKGEARGIRMKIENIKIGDLNG